MTVIHLRAPRPVPSLPEPLLCLDDHRGVYIPRDFAELVDRSRVIGITPNEWACLEAGPNYEHYWDVWNRILDDAHVIDPEKNITYSLYQDGPLWLIPDGMEWDESTEWFRWPAPAPNGTL